MLNTGEGKAVWMLTKSLKDQLKKRLGCKVGQNLDAPIVYHRIVSRTTTRHLNVCEWGVKIVEHALASLTLFDNAIPLYGLRVGSLLWGGF